MSLTLCGDRKLLCLPVKNINVGEVHEERMGCVDQEEREAMVGSQWAATGSTLSFQHPHPTLSQQTTE